MTGATGADYRLRDRDLWDVLAALCLDALVVFAWSTTYAGSGWWVAALVAALFSVCVVVVVRDMGGNPVLVPGVLLGAYVVCAGPLAAGTLAAGGSADTFTDGLAATGESWGDLLGTHPPVDASGALLIPPVLVSILIAGLASTVALWTSRPAAPLVPAGLGLLVVLLMGRQETTWAVLVGLGFAAVSLLWVRMRAGRLDEQRFGADPVRARGLVLGLVVLLAGTAAAVGVVGEPGSDRVLLRDQVRGYDVSSLTTPLDEFRDFTPQPPGTPDNVNGERLFIVDGLPAGTRLRFAALDTYDGRRWSAEGGTDPQRDDDAFLHVSSTIDNPADGREATVEITTTRFWDRPWVPTIGAVQGFAFADDELRDDLRYNPATQTAVLPDGLGGKVTYTITTRLDAQRATPDLLASPDDDAALGHSLGVLDPALDAWDRDAFTSVRALFNVMGELKRVGRFSHGAEPWTRQYLAGHGLRQLTDDFLYANPTVGDQEQYAAAVALMAARRFIPVRVVVGAVVPRGGVVQGRDVTAWIEIRVRDGSWRTIPTDVFMGQRPPDRDGGPPVPRDFPPQPPAPDQDDTADTQDEPDAADPADAGEDGGTRWAWLLALVLLVPLVPPLLKWRRRRGRLRAARVSSRYAGAWEELVDRARDLGVPIARATRPAQAAELERAGDLALQADRRIFSAEELDAAEAAEFWRLVRTELRDLDGTRPRWRRWWAVVNPRSLWS